MRISGITRCAAVIALLVLLSCPTLAAVEVLEAQGNLSHWVLYASSHSPCAGASWSHEVEEGTAFDLQATSYDGSCVESSWSGRSDAGGFLYYGELSPVSEGHLGWNVHLESQISVLLELTTSTRISAIRSVEGMLSPALHTVLLTLPGGASDVLLGSDPGINSAERMLSAGIYRITFSIGTDDVWYPPFSYAGLVEVNWDGPVGVENQTWGGLKSLYHGGR